MSWLAEGGDLREGGPASRRFAKTRFLRVIDDRDFSCSIQATTNVIPYAAYVVEADSRPNGIFEASVLCGKYCACCGHEAVKTRSHLSESANEVGEILWISIPTCVSEGGDRCFYRCRRVESVTFGASSKLERICEWAFSETGIGSLAIPDSVVEIGKGCFSKCKSLRSVRFGPTSKLERLCAEAFAETSIESLFIPDSVVELGRKCFD